MLVFSNDDQIIEHYLKRLNSAIMETKCKYGNLIYKIAYNILLNCEDSEECENDTYLKLWNSIPPNIPENLKAYCLKITRNLALKRNEYNCAAKRSIKNQTSFDVLVEEYGEICLVEHDVENSEELAEVINYFINTLSYNKRKIFILRYWYFMSIKDIMIECNMTQSQVEMTLFRLRKQFKNLLIERGYFNE